MQKTCKKCGRTKSAIHFAMNSRSSDLLTSVCRSCTSGYKRDNNYHDKYWGARLQRRTELNRSQAASAQGKARQRVRTGVYRGKIDKPNHCELCGIYLPEKRLLTSHHPDYDHPNEYIWICFTCHGIMASICNEAKAALEDYDPESKAFPWETYFLYPVTKFIVRWRSLGILESEFFEFLRVYRATLSDVEEHSCD